MKWKPPEEALLRSLWETRDSVKEIAVKIGHSIGACERRAHELRLAVKPRTVATRNGFSWTDEITERLREMWAQRMPASAIAAALGAPSRNTVCGKLKRLGLVRDALPKRQIVATARRTVVAQIAPLPSRHAGGSPAKNFTAVPLPAPIARMDEPNAVGPLRDFPGVGCCKYIHGEVGKDWRCCAAPTPSVFAPWCSYHQRVCMPGQSPEVLASRRRIQERKFDEANAHAPVGESEVA